jgi:hypothetical protein
MKAANGYEVSEWLAVAAVFVVLAAALLHC